MPISLTIRRLLSIQPIDLPVFHPIALKLVHLLSDQNFTIDELASTANDDQALAGQILNMANSSSYIGRVKVETIKDALIRLGAHHVSNLAMAASQAALHSSHNSTVNAIMRELWLHSHGCAVGCRWVAMNTGHRALAEQAYLAGLLHDVGKLYLVKALERITNAGVAQAALERDLLLEIFAELHVEQGTRLMEHWSMPSVYRAAVDKHSCERFDPDDMVLVIVRLVNMATRMCGLSLVAGSDQPFMELPEVALLGLSEQQLAELVQVLEESRHTSFLSPPP
ncbi:HDOD domain-containing protein [Geobacter sp. AOG2]|uniref:HDOD domain-containing protein n=1 Tax=Geobacter sp. AOG2 TaxID=1566347 RepID=UPI001CC61419|nr:HDOD domain-containing protein [Geobacter sp. AOG2]GFE60140.1 metal-dependent phosphohydrolase [Geobacter sp. AOG2]